MPNNHRGKARFMKRARQEISNGCARLSAYGTRDAAERELPSVAAGSNAAETRYCRNCRCFHIYIT